MDTCQIIQLVYIFVIFFLTMLFILLPLKLIPADVAQLSTRRTQRIIDFCNSFAGGIFLGTCFVQLVPYVEMKFAEAFTVGGLMVMYCPTLTQVTVMLGFFLVLLMEQVVKSCHGSGGGRKRGDGVDDSQEMSAVKGYIVAVSSSDDEGDDSLGSEESDVELTREKKRMLKPKDAGNKTATKTATKKATTTKCKHLHNKSNDATTNANDNADGSHGIGKTNNVATSSHHHVHGLVHLSDLAREEFGLRCVVLLFALSLHSLFEGLAIGLQDDLWKLVNLTVAIGIHECLVAFALGISLARQNLSRSTVVKLCLAFGLTIPVGIGVGMAVGGIHTFVSSLVSAVLQGLTAGTFVYVIFVEILPGEIDRNRDRLLKVLVMFIGFAIIGCIAFILHH